MTSKKEYNLIDVIETVANEIMPELDIVTVKISGKTKSPIVRVYIDHECGVGFDLLCDAQKWISKVLDEIDPFPGTYTLEVSSPGPNRDLRKLSHFQKFIGRKAKIQTNKTIDGCKIFNIFIRDVDNDNIICETVDDKKNIQLCIDDINKANLKD